MDVFGNLLLNLYEAPEDSSAWTKFGSALADATGSCAFEISKFENNDISVRQMTVPFLSDADITTYVNEMIHINPRIAYGKEHLLEMRVYSDHIAFDLETLTRHPFIEWSRSLGIQYAAGSVTSTASDNLYTYFLHRSVNEGVISREGLSLIRRLYPHFQRAVSLSDLVSQEQCKASLGQHLLNNSCIGIIILDKLLKVKEINQLAENFINQSGELEFLPSKKLGLTSHASKSLKDFFKQISVPKFDGHLSQYAAARLTIREQQDIYLFSVPIQRDKSGVDLTTSNVANLIYFIDKGIDKRHHGLERIFKVLGLSNREAQVAIGLYQGAQPKEIAFNLDIAENTVRTYIRAIYSKLNINRQTQLVRFITELRAFFIA